MFRPCLATCVRLAVAGSSSHLNTLHSRQHRWVSSAADAHQLEKERELASKTMRDNQAMGATVPPPSPSPPSPPSEGKTSGGSSNDSQGSAQNWVEPTIADLDRSIPQVDCKFIADLIRTRNARRQEFLRQRDSAKSRLSELLRVFEGKNASSEQQEKAVVHKLTPEEQDALAHQRPEYDDGFVLIDCRTVNEITSWGIIEGAKVLPAHEMFEAFHMTPEEFEVHFGFAKPKPEQTVIFYCQYGPRSLMAAQILSWMGYENVMHFRDGYHDWAKQYNLLVRRWMEHDKTSGNNVKRLVAFEAARQLQREIAPEFNALPLQEMQRYVIDETRSKGTLRVGERVRENALKKLAGIAVEPAKPDMLPGTVDDGKGIQVERLHQYLSTSTGVKPATELEKKEQEPQRTIGDAQHRIAVEMEHPRR